MGYTRVPASFIIYPLGSISSLITAALALYRVKKRRATLFQCCPVHSHQLQRSQACGDTLDASMRGEPITMQAPSYPSQPTRLLDALLLALSSIQVVAYAIMCAFLPLLWTNSPANIVFRPMRKGLFTDVLSHWPHNRTWSLALLDRVFLISALWMKLFWHAVIAFSLCAVIVRKVPAQTVRCSLPRALKACFVLVLLELTVDMISIFYRPAAYLMNVGVATTFMLLFVTVGGTYGATLYEFLSKRGSRMPLPVRLFRNRLLLVCTYLMVYIIGWNIVSVAGLFKRRVLLVNYAAEFCVAYQGLFDSLVMSDLFGFWGMMRHRKERRERRHLSDSRIRVGRSSGSLFSLSMYRTSRGYGCSNCKPVPTASETRWGWGSCCCEDNDVEGPQLQQMYTEKSEEKYEGKLQEKYDDQVKQARDQKGEEEEEEEVSARGYVQQASAGDGEP